MVIQKIPLLHPRNVDHGAGEDEKGWYEANILICDIVLICNDIFVFLNQIYILCQGVHSFLGRSRIQTAKCKNHDKCLKYRWPSEQLLYNVSESNSPLELVCLTWPSWLRTSFSSKETVLFALKIGAHASLLLPLLNSLCRIQDSN